MGQCTVCALVKTLIESQKAQTIMPHLIYSKLLQICSTMKYGQQEDCHEFWIKLKQSMHSALSKYSENQYINPIEKIFGGRMAQILHCAECNKESITYVECTELILSIDGQCTLNESLDNHFHSEYFDDIGFKCENCGKMSGTKKLEMEKVPTVLCLILKRFATGSRSKLNKKIEITQHLNFSSKKYRLSSVITHHGDNMENGHYKAIGITSMNKYYQFDDTKVNEMSIQNMLHASTSNAYMLFYEVDTDSSSTNLQHQQNSKTNTKMCPFLKDF